MVTSWIYSLLILPLIMVEVSCSRRLSIGPDAQRLCRTYRKVCSTGRFCAMQYFHKPRNISLPICVPEYFIPAEHRICDLQPDHGKCGARYIRWFYHKIQNKCNWFYFGGCDGNQNNFKNKQECEQTCKVAHTTVNNNAHNRNNAIALPVTSPVVVSEPIFLPERTNQITRSLSLRSKKVGTKLDKDRRRKRRLRDRKKRRLEKRRLRRRRKLIVSRKRRRDGKVTGRKRKNKKKKKHGKKSKKKNKNKKNRKNKGRKSSMDDEESIKENGMTHENRANDKNTDETQSSPRTLTILDTGDEVDTDDWES